MGYAPIAALDPDCCTASRSPQGRLASSGVQLTQGGIDEIMLASDEEEEKGEAPQAHEQQQAASSCGAPATTPQATQSTANKPGHNKTK